MINKANQTMRCMSSCQWQFFIEYSYQSFNQWSVQMHCKPEEEPNKRRWRLPMDSYSYKEKTHKSSFKLVSFYIADRNFLKTSQSIILFYYQKLYYIALRCTHQAVMLFVKIFFVLLISFESAPKLVCSLRPMESISNPLKFKQITNPLEKQHLRVIWVGYKSIKYDYRYKTGLCTAPTTNSC